VKEAEELLKDAYDGVRTATHELRTAPYGKEAPFREALRDKVVDGMRALSRSAPTAQAHPNNVHLQDLRLKIMVRGFLPSCAAPSRWVFVFSSPRVLLPSPLSMCRLHLTCVRGLFRVWYACVCDVVYSFLSARPLCRVVPCRVVVLWGALQNAISGAATKGGSSAPPKKVRRDSNRMATGVRQPGLIREFPNPQQRRMRAVIMSARENWLWVRPALFFLAACTQPIRHRARAAKTTRLGAIGWMVRAVRLRRERIRKARLFALGLVAGAAERSKRRRRAVKVFALGMGPRVLALRAAYVTALFFLFLCFLFLFLSLAFPWRLDWRGGEVIGQCGRVCGWVGIGKCFCFVLCDCAYVLLTVVFPSVVVVCAGAPFHACCCLRGRQRRRTMLFCVGAMATALRFQRGRRQVAKMFAAGVFVTEKRTNGNPTGYVPPKPKKVCRHDTIRWCCLILSLDCLVLCVSVGLCAARKVIEEGEEEEKEEGEVHWAKDAVSVLGHAQGQANPWHDVGICSVRAQVRGAAANVPRP